jgi:hypothetical protein
VITRAALRMLVLGLVTALVVAGFPAVVCAQSTTDDDSSSDDAKAFTFGLLLVVIGILVWVGILSDRYDRANEAQEKAPDSRARVVPVVMDQVALNTQWGERTSDRLTDNLGLGVQVDF